jgi:hypothetical protein
MDVHLGFLAREEVTASSRSTIGLTLGRYPISLSNAMKVAGVRKAERLGDEPRVPFASVSIALFGTRTPEPSGASCPRA